MMIRFRSIQSDDRPSVGEPSLIQARAALIQAARALSLDTSIVSESIRYRSVVDRLESIDLLNQSSNEDSILAGSPYVVMTSGGTRSLIEMLLEDSSEFDLERVGKLLLRSLHWKLPRRNSMEG